ncbi:MAG: transporter ATP-binding protein [Verrucomicrobia bacterium]|nr:transporter ATP-binding protein [Verrucomicrobiota bacterium]
MTPAIELCALTKDFPVGWRGARVRALNAINLTIAPGQVFGLLGPNGSGKSTVLKIAAGLLEPTSGACRIFGVEAGSFEARSLNGYLPDAPHFYRFLSGRELVNFYGGLSGLRGSELGRRADEAIEAVGMTPAANRRVGTYSKGMLQRIGLAQAIVHRPRLLVLDEPAAGMDESGVAMLNATIRNLVEDGATVVLTSHDLGQVGQVCDRVATLELGRLMRERAVGEVSELTAESYSI